MAQCQQVEGNTNAIPDSGMVRVGTPEEECEA
jgi:hypothetical protein